jgi:serine protease Do
MESRSRYATGLLTLIIVVISGIIMVESDLLMHISYAAEKGRIEAEADELADLQSLENLSHAFRIVARKVSPAVVNIDTTSAREPISQEELDALPEAFRRFDRLMPPEDHGLGSGMVVKADGGYILTNNHVVRDANEIRVTLQDGRQVLAEFVGSDPRTDLAVIRVDADFLHEVEFGDSEAMEVGEFVLAIGSPLGYDQTVSHGIISARGRSTQLPLDIYENFIQTDAAINPGNSGGPLVNLRGQVIGMNTAIATRTGGKNGIGFAIPAKRIVQVLPYLIAGEEIVRGFLGVEMTGVRNAPEIAQRLGWSDPYGVIVSNVLSERPAATAGVLANDIILAVNEVRMNTSSDLQDYIAYTAPGTVLSLEIWRDKDRMKLPTEVPRDAVALGDLGLKVRTLDSALAEQHGWREETSGAVIVEIEPNGPAAQKGLSVGDLIQEVQEEDVVSATQLSGIVSERIEKGQSVRIYVRSAAAPRQNRHVVLRSPR